MKKIYIVASSTSKVFRYLRNHLPVRHCGEELKADGIELMWGPISKQTPAADVYIFNGALYPESIEIVEGLAENADVVWQLDDDYWNIPPTNPASRNVNKFLLAGLDYCLDLAKVIFVTVDHLNDVVGRKDKTLIVPNLVDMDDYPEYSPKNSTGCLWAGGPTHWSDLEVVGNVPHRMPDRRFIFLGMLPNQCAFYDLQPGFLDKLNVAPALPNVGFNPAVRFEDYQQVLLRLASQSGVGICPLANHKFNHSKSPLKFLEFAACGLPVVASPVVYGNVIADGVNGLVASTEDEWVEKIGFANNELGRAGYEWVRDNASWQSSAREKWLKAFSFIAHLPVYPNVIWGPQG